MYRKLAAFAIATGLVLAAFTTTIVEESSRANAIPLPAEDAFETVRAYDVRGTSLDALRADVFARGPFDSTKKVRFAGWTDWEIKWRFEYEDAGRECSITRAFAEAHVTYTLPRWVDEARASTDLRAAWRQFAAALAEHEKGHGHIARQLARRIEKEMAAIAPQPDCAKLRGRVNALATRMVEADETQDEYDRRTGHGESQGAVFPRMLARSDGPAQATN